MTLYPLLPLATCVVTGALAAVILARDPKRRANRLAALLVAGGAFWSACDVLWSVQSDPAAVMEAWMNSPGHKANILNCDFKTLGVGVVFGSGGPWWTQDFGY